MGVDPESPDAGDCGYCPAVKYCSSPAYSLCSRNGRLASKAIVTDVANEENRPR